MPINILSWDSEHVLAEYVDTTGQVFPLPEILGEIEDYQDAQLTALDEADRLGLINSGQKLSLRRHIINPPTSEFMQKIANKRWKKT